MFALTALCLLSAFSPAGTRKILNLPKPVLIAMSIIFSLVGLLMLYAAFMPTVPQD